MSTNYIEKALRIGGTGTIGFWPLNEESGTVAYDLSSNGYNGTYSGLVTVPETRGFTGPDGGKCTQFDGTTIINLINAAPSSASSSQTEGSLSMWVATPETNLTGTTLMQLAIIGADTANSIELEFDTTANRFAAQYFAGSGDATYSTNNASLVYNENAALYTPQWHHLGMTYSATNDALIVYTNGTPSTTASSLGTWTGNYAAGLMALGTTSSTGSAGAGATNGFTGWMSNVLWTTQILTDANMAELAKAGP
jgi:hypothetical protein